MVTRSYSFWLLLCPLLHLPSLGLHLLSFLFLLLSSPMIQTRFTYCTDDLYIFIPNPDLSKEYATYAPNNCLQSIPLPVFAVSVSDHSLGLNPRSKVAQAKQKTICIPSPRMVFWQECCTQVRLIHVQS